MISIDNAVELMIKTYLGLPKRVTGLSLSRKDFQDMAESFPKLLDGLETYAPDKLDGIDLGTIEWYHRLRNQLYHQGNGLTIDRDKITIYAEIANLLFKNLFGEELVPHATSDTETLGAFLEVWVGIERNLHRLAEITYENRPPGSKINMGPVASFLARGNVIDRAQADEIEKLRHKRNQVVYGEIDASTTISSDLMKQMLNIRDLLSKKVVSLSKP